MDFYYRICIYSRLILLVAVLVATVRCVEYTFEQDLDLYYENGYTDGTSCRIYQLLSQAIGCQAVYVTRILAWSTFQATME
jgi:hypothetical protein